MMIPSSESDDLRSRIGQVLSRSGGRALVESLPVDEMVETVNVYHKELQFQNEELHRIRGELEVSNSQLADLFQNAPVAYVLCDSEGTVKKFNGAAVSLFSAGGTIGFLGRPLSSFFAPESQDEFYFHMRRIASLNESMIARAMVVSGTDSVPVVVRSRMFPGETPLISTVFIDVRNEERMIALLRAAHEHLTELVAQLPVAVVELDEHGTVVLLNRTFSELFGWTLVDTPDIDRLLLRLWDGEDGRSRVHALVRGGTESRIETRVVTCLGDSRIVSLHLCLTGTHRLLVMVDISEQRRAEERERLLEENLNQSQKLEALGTMAGGIAHDFNNLLTGLYGNLDLALLRSRDEYVTEKISTALGSLDRAQKLTGQMLTFARGGEPELKTAPLFPFVEDTIRFAVAGRPHELSIEIAPDLPACCYDSHRIAQVIDNIVVNALAAMPAGGNLRITARRVDNPPGVTPGPYVELSISDTGTGIPDDVLPKVFDPFFTTKKSGTGLGLSTSFSIMRRHNGAIQIDSQPGLGTEVHLLLPVSDIAAEPEKSSDPVPDSSVGAGLILVMDDEPIIREMLAELLSSLGFTPIVAADGRQLVQLFKDARKRGPICASFLDLTVPGGIGGVETARILREEGSDFPLFVASGYSEDPAIARPGDFGFSGSICKPFRRHDIVAMLKLHHLL